MLSIRDGFDSFSVARLQVVSEALVSLSFGQNTCPGCTGAAAKHDHAGSEMIHMLAGSTPPVVYNTGDIPGDSSTTVSIAVGESLSSELEIVGDTDWIRIDLDAGENITISLFGSGTNPVSDTYLRVRDANGNEIAFNDDGGSGLNSLMRFIADTSGTYYIEVDSYANNKVGTYTLEVTESLPLEVYDYDQIADQLTSGYWGGGVRSFDITSGQISYDISALTAAAQFLASEAMALWADITGIVFVSNPGSAQITFQDTDEGAYASSSRSGNTILSSTVNVSADWVARYGASLDSYSFQTYVHEIGHALGLGHGGNYNGDASYLTDAIYANDAWSTTIMSYFSQRENLYFADLGFSPAPLTSPMNADIVAITRLYGQSSTTRTGDTVYGFNNTSNRDIHDATLFSTTAYTIVDSAGNDTLDYSGYGSDQLIDLRTEVFMNIGGLVGNIVIGRGTLIENAIGGSGNDRLNGNWTNNVLVAGFGNDVLVGYGGNDILDGGAGADILYGETGNDKLYGHIDDDVIWGGDGDDVLDGSYGYDELYGEAGDDVMLGGSGKDFLDGGSGRDRLFGGDGDDKLYGHIDDDEIYGGNGDDVLDGSYGYDSLYGEAGDDVLRGGSGKDFLDGGSGRDYLSGGDGDDKLYGHIDDDKIYGGNGDDVLDGSYGYDNLYGEAGDDVLRGGSGKDFLDGGADWDYLFGGDGDDKLFGHTGNDTMYGDAGNDVLDGSFGWDDLFGGDGNDVLRGDTGNDFLSGGKGRDILTGGSGNDVFFFGEFSSANADQIRDFVSGEDVIVLDQSAFSTLSLGTLAAGQFRAGSDAVDADDRILYDSSTGNIFYDADGVGGAAKQLFATVASGTLLSHTDFAIEPSPSSMPEPAKSMTDLSALMDIFTA